MTFEVTTHIIIFLLNVTELQASIPCICPLLCKISKGNSDKCTCRKHLSIISVPLLQDKVRPNDLWSLLFSARQASPRSRDMVWEFVQEKWTWLKERYQGSFLLGRVAEVCQGKGRKAEKGKHAQLLYTLIHSPNVEM